MSSALALSAVSFVLQYYLHALYANHTGPLGGQVKLSAVAPDIVQNDIGGSTAAQNQVNLFLHQVTPNPAWRNMGLASVAPDGQNRLKNPPLALDLHYLLTAYATSDWQAEALLGYALLMLHQNPVLARSDIATALSNASAYEAANSLSGFLNGSGLADQIEMIKITPSTFGREELAWLWTALKADYRPTFPFQVSVVLIVPQAQTVFSFPALHRRIHAEAISPAQISAIQPPTGKLAPVSGDQVVVTGSSLGAASQVLLSNQRLGITRPVPLTPAQITYTSVTFTVPNDTPADPLPAGVYDLSIVLTGIGGNPGQTTNSLPIGVAPVIVSTGPISADATSTTIPVTCSPYVLPVQNVSFLLGNNSAPAQPFGTPPSATQPFGGSANSLSFEFSPPLATGTYVMRLEIDGVSSAVTWTKTPPAITGPTVNV